MSLGLEFPTGIMRGRFHPTNGHLYATGMFAWAGNKHRDGGFYRIRYTGKPAQLPIGLHAQKNGIRLTFSEAIDPKFAVDPANYQIKVWDIRRSKNYGSRHYNEHPLLVSKASVGEDGKSVFLTIPDISPTWCMEIVMSMRTSTGETVKHVLHNTIHKLQTGVTFK